MKLLILLLAASCVFAAPKPREACNEDTCKLPDCRCTGTDIPGGLAPKDVPQFVYLTFDDAVTAANYEFYNEVFTGRSNPDGCPISATYFVSHEYTDYSKVHALHAAGHEIALHSITHTSLTDYWKNRTVEELVEEFGGEKELVSKFADIDIESIKGVRYPLLQLAGDASYEAIQKAGLEWDCSWPTRSFIEPGLWPYSLTHGHSQDCPIDPCPSQGLELEGVWVNPMIMWFDEKNITCSMVDACTNIPDDADGIFNFMVKNFKTQYEGNRAPFGAYMHAAWFGQHAKAFEAYKKFVDFLQTLPDVFIVGISRGLEWVRNPTPIGDLKNLWPECQTTYEPTCQEKSCTLDKEGEERWMKVCTECPKVFPWLGNPMGN